MDVKDSCVFYADWLEAAHTIEDPTLRCGFFEAVLQYALTGMEMDTPPELKIVMTIVKKCIDRDKDKYEKKIEKRREAGKMGGAPLGNQNARKYLEQPNQANGCLINQNQANQANQAVNVNVNDNGNVNGNVNGKDNNVFKPSPKPPKGGRALNFEDFYLRVAGVSIPKAIEELHYERQYVWRMAEGIPGYGMEIAEAIKTKTDSDLQNAIADINKRYQPKTAFEGVKLAMETVRLKTSAQKKAIFDELRRSENEPDIIKTLTEKAEYINAGGRVTSLAGFMKSRK